MNLDLEVNGVVLEAAREAQWRRLPVSGGIVLLCTPMNIEPQRLDSFQRPVVGIAVHRLV